MTLVHTFLILVALQQPVLDGDPRAVVRRAVRAVRTDSVAIVAREWSERFSRDGGDRAALLGLATLARWTYDYAEADSLYRQLVLPEDRAQDPVGIVALLGYADGIRWRGGFGDSERWYQYAVEHAHALGDSALEAWALVQLATVRGRTTGAAEARALFLRADSLIPPGDDEVRALAHCVGAGLGVTGDGRSVREEAEAGALLARGIDDPSLEATCLQVVAQTFVRNGDIDSALVTLGLQRNLQEATRDRVGLAATHQWAGYLLRTVAAPGRARDLLFAAITDGEVSGNLSPVAWAYLNLGQIARQVGDPTTASEYADRAEELLLAQNDNWGLAGARDLRASIAQRVGDHDLARAKYAEALEWYTQANNQANIFGHHFSFAEIAITEGDWPEAERQSDIAQSIARERGLSGWETGLLPLRARVATARGMLQQAEALLTDYLPSQRSPLRVYSGLAQRASVYALMGDLDRAAEDLARGLDQLDAWRATLGARDLRRYAFQVQQGLLDPDLGVATVIASLAAAGRIEQAFHIAERQRARELLERMVRADALRTDDGADAAAAGSEFGTAAPESADSLVAALPDDDTAILQYVTGFGGEPTTAFVITTAGINAHVLPPADSLSAAIARFTLLTSEGVESGDLAHQLGDVLLQAPLSALTNQPHRLVVVPDGPLHRLAFDALQLSDGRFVVERYEVSQAPSASVARQLWSRRRDAVAVSALAFGDVAFPTDPGSGTSAVYFRAFKEETGLRRLGASRREAKTVGRFAHESEVRLGSAASEAYLKGTTLDRFSVIHFATHARVDDWAVTRTALALAPGEGEDGFVGPGDLAALKLNADLVVLSACRTAAGVVIRGEGVQGLTAPLLQAGARAVIATAWPISDRAAAEFVEEFYRNAATGVSVGHALHQAKLTALANGAPPSEWAAFTLVGDPGVRLSLQTPSPSAMTRYWWLLLVIAFGIGTVTWRLIRRRRDITAHRYETSR